MKPTSSIIQQEFIGTETKVAQSSNPSHVGISGKVLDETRNTFTILHRGKQKLVAKAQSVFLFTLPDGTGVKVDGKVLIGRPEDRVKKVVRRRW
jgi:ribonuclease P protein subunit POP4